MKRKKIAIVLVACLLVGIGLFAFWPGEREPKEPEYRGKKLTEWLRPYEPRYSERGHPAWMNEADQKIADNAVRQIGTNALPWMLKWIAHKAPAWKEELWRISEKIPGNLTDRWFPKRDFSELAYFQMDAEIAFRILGPAAAPAVPQISHILKHPRFEGHRRAAMWALSSIGREGLPPLLDALEDENLKHPAALCIVRMCDAGVDISRAMPAILMIDRETGEIAKTNRFLDYGYAIAASHYSSPLMIEDRNSLISALTNCLHHPNDDVRVEAANALGRLGEEARPAVPALKEWREEFLNPSSASLKSL